MALKEKNDSSDITAPLENSLKSLEKNKYTKKSIAKNKIYSIRLPEDYKILLENHFNEKGISFSTGVRMILVQYIKRLNKK